MGWCPIHQRVRSPYKEPYYLVSNDGKRFRLEFDCKNCQMKVKSGTMKRFPDRDIRNFTEFLFGREKLRTALCCSVMGIAVEFAASFDPVI